MPEIERDGARVHYDVDGPTGGDGPAIVLGHALMGDASMWRGVVPALARRRRVINVEVRGHHRSTAPRRFTLEDLAADWLAILDAERIDRAVLCGLSMGGMTATRLALAAPDRVAGLVLIDSSGDREPARVRARNWLLASIIRLVGVAAPLERKLAALMLGASSRARDPGLVAALHEIVARHGRAGLARAMRAVNARGPILDRLAAITAPTLVLVGEEDVATPVDKSARLAAAIPGARMERLPALGHLSPLEDPAAVIARIEPFLASLAR